LRGSGRFLKKRNERPDHGLGVSIPFIAGQWSLLAAPGGSVRTSPRRLNPLHCGAVVASWSWVARSRRRASGLNPLHCGAVVASRRPAERGDAQSRVSIPFIAGQWSLLGGSGYFSSSDFLSQSPSLRGSGRFGKEVNYGNRKDSCLNPLHCGAVVASRMGTAGTFPSSFRLNPLHCGAVVASPL